VVGVQLHTLAYVDPQSSLARRIAHLGNQYFVKVKFSKSVIFPFDLVHQFINLVRFYFFFKIFLLLCQMQLSLARVTGAALIVLLILSAVGVRTR
jgi:hypothetical protein